MSVRCLLTSLVLASVLVLAPGLVAAEDKGQTDETPRKQAPGEQKQSKQPRGEVRDVILMLQPGPLHLRFHIALGGKSLPELREAYVDRLIKTLDADEDGQLTREETSRSPLLRKKQRPKAKAFLQSLGQAQVLSRRDIMQSVQRQSGEIIVYREDKTSSENDGELFAFLDEDGDGVLNHMELFGTGKRILEKDNDGDENVSFEELLPEEEPEPQPAVLAPQLPQPRRPTQSATVTMLRDTRHVMLAGDLVRKYDRNRDRGLSQKETGWLSETFEFLDTDENKVLDAAELTFVHRAPVDLELAIDLDPGDSATPAVQVLAVNGRQLKATNRPDFCRIEFQGAVVTFARRYLDPFVDSIDNAMIEFNNMDGDANGYLEKSETEQETRLARGGFETIDADGDGKIFAEEMERYIRVFTEPIASTCAIKIYDTGHGFFMALDANGDGRIGIRERRQAARSLAMMDRDGVDGVSRREPVRHFHVEFVRGTYRMFGSMNESVAETPAFQQRSEVGPVWFRRMDRNGDGDISWDEFFGPRDVFHSLDTDHDGLIDSAEAMAAARLADNQAEQDSE